jgi:chromosome segregation ATPase
MLADEQALRDQFNALHDRAKRLKQHVEFDDQLRALLSQSDEISRKLVSDLTALTNQFGLIMVNGQGECEKAREQLTNLEALRIERETILSQFADICVARAELLGTVPVDREDMASQIDLVAKHLEDLQAGIDRNRAMFTSLCPDAGSTKT